MTTLSSVGRSLSIRRHPLLWGCFSLILICISLVVSIGLGAVSISPEVVFQALFAFQPENTSHQLVREIRIPRALASALIGAGLALAGAVMQGITRNPLADPSIIGVTQGSGLTIAIAMAAFSSSSYWALLGWSFLGSSIGAALVLSFSLLAGRQLSPVTLTLAGAALSTLFGALSTGIALYFQIAQDLSFWFAGGLSGSKWEHIYLLLPIVLLGLALSLYMQRSLTILAMGEDVAAGLGQSRSAIWGIGLFVVVLLSGAAVSIAGAIGFIGLVVPHIVRLITGPHYALILPFSAITGALLLILADIGARMLNPPFETPVSAITALIGVPFFLYLARKNRRSF